MRDFIKNLLINFAVAVLCVSVGLHLMAWFAIEVSLIFELFCVVLLTRLLQLLINKFNSEYIVLEYLLELVMFTSVILAGWWFFGWHEYVSVIFILIITVVIYIVMFALDFAKINSDIAYINEQIRQKNAKKKQSDK